MQQKINISQKGAYAIQILEVLTPVNDVVAPAVNAKFLGQMYVNTAAIPVTVHVAVAVGSVVKANDWKLVTLT